MSKLYLVVIAALVVGCSESSDKTDDSPPVPIKPEPPAPKTTPRDDNTAADLLPGGAHARLTKLAAACDGGDHRACFRLGLAFELGVGGLAKSGHTALWEMSCVPSKDVTYGCLHFTQNDPTIAQALCQAGRRDACDAVIAGRSIAGALAASPELEQVFSGACRAGSKIVCEALPELTGVASPGDPESSKLPAGAIDDAKTAAALCDRNIAVGCTDLGRMYAFEPEAKRAGVSVDAAHAQKLADRTCNDKTKMGCVILADLSVSKGKFDDQVKNHLRESCDAGHRASCGALLGALDVAGTAEEKDEAAYMSLELCSEIGSKASCQMAHDSFGP